MVSIKNTNEKYILMCQQLRVPMGGRMTEACAGMLDENVEDGQILGVVFKEIREETGFIVKQNELISLGFPIIPSGGGCDEEIHLFAWETEITRKEYNKKCNKLFGDQYESIKLNFYDYNTFDTTLDFIGDVKAECAWRRYTNMKK